MDEHGTMFYLKTEDTYKYVRYTVQQNPGMYIGIPIVQPHPLFVFHKSGVE